MLTQEDIKTYKAENVMQYDMQDFQDSCDRFNIIAGKVHNKPSKQEIKQQLDLIKEELQETYDALELEDYTKVLDGYCDILVTSFGLGQQLKTFGIDTMSACRDTAENNLMKFIWIGSNWEEASALAYKSMQELKSKGVNASPVFSALGGCFVLKDSNNKIRKPFGFNSNDLSMYVPDVLKGK